MWTNGLLNHYTQAKVLPKPDKTLRQDWPRLLTRADADMEGGVPEWLETNLEKETGLGKPNVRRKS